MRKDLRMKLAVWCRGLVVVVVLPLACTPPEDKAGTKTDKKTKEAEPEVKIEDLKVGTGEPAKDGDWVVVHYTGWLTDDTKFDSSVDRQDPLEFRLGSGGVIKGWHKGVAGMKVGGKRRLTIPAELGYGKGGSPPRIPPNATLIFEIDVLKIKH